MAIANHPSKITHADPAECNGDIVTARFTFTCQLVRGQG
jgi:hypothetical protein